MKLLLTHLLLAPILVVISGCETIYEGKYDWDAGWRPGTVLEIGSADSLIKEPFRDCRKDPRVAELKASTFAVVSYRFLNRPRKAVVPVPSATRWTTGSPVYINVHPDAHQCAAHLRHRRHRGPAHAGAQGGA